MKLRELDYGLPIDYLKGLLRDLAEQIAAQEIEPSEWQIQRLATLHQAIAALEGVKTQMDAERG